MKPSDKIRNEQLAARIRVFKMMQAAADLSMQKGRHDLEKGCNCLSCAKKRKAILYPKIKPWKYTL
jgi:hypothetical protein